MSTGAKDPQGRPGQPEQPGQARRAGQPGGESAAGASVDLASVRAHIDRIDEAIVAMLAERQRWVVTAGNLKTDAAAVRAPDRVEAVIARAKALATEAGASPQVVEATYRAMIAAFIALELDVHSFTTD